MFLEISTHLYVLIFFPLVHFFTLLLTDCYDPVSDVSDTSIQLLRRRYSSFQEAKVRYHSNLGWEYTVTVELKPTAERAEKGTKLITFFTVYRLRFPN